MNYTIRASVYESEKAGENPEKGFCTLVFGDSFKVTNIAILENKSSGELFVSMPRYLSNEKDENGNQIYKDVCNPITKEFREELYTNILKAFERTMSDEKAVLTVDAEDKQSPNFKVSVTPFEREGSQLRGLARIYIHDNFIINNVNIIQGSNGLFVTMPSYKTKQVDDNGKDVYRDICYPVTKNFRETLYKAILEEYGNRKDRSEDDFAEYIEQQKLDAASTEKKAEEKSETKSEDKDSDKKNSPNGKESKGKSGKEKR
ncbi:MAG: SpoVG family protein [Eubacterium sp.]|nr:SpoVG family protein [Eubacterium sp.]